ncbi:MAG: hypothetical protein ABIH92_02360 [Nanoarchaeota archaeon]
MEGRRGRFVGRMLLYAGLVVANTARITGCGVTGIGTGSGGHIAIPSMHDVHSVAVAQGGSQPYTQGRPVYEIEEDVTPRQTEEYNEPVGPLTMEWLNSMGP